MFDRLRAWMNGDDLPVSGRSKSNLGPATSLVYPPPDQGFPRTSRDELMSAERERITKIAHNTKLDPEKFDLLMRPVIERFVGYVHLLPASQGHHHRGSGGLLAHSLEVSFFASQAASAKIFGFGETSIRKKREIPRWHVAAALVGLLHDVGKPISDMTIKSPKGETWNPFVEPLDTWAKRVGAHRYHLIWRAKRNRRHEKVGSTIVPEIITPQMKAWLTADDSTILEAVLNALSGNGDEELLHGMMTRADEASVSADMKKMAHTETEPLGTIESAVEMQASETAGKDIAERHRSEAEHAGYDGGASQSSADMASSGGDERVDKAPATEKMAAMRPVMKQVVGAMQSLIDDGTWTINCPGSRIWSGKRGVFLVWKKGVSELVTRLDERGVTGIPNRPEVFAEALVDAQVATAQTEATNAEHRRSFWYIWTPLIGSGNSKPYLTAIKFSDASLFNVAWPEDIEITLQSDKTPSDEKLRSQGIKAPDQSVREEQTRGSSIAHIFNQEHEKRPPDHETTTTDDAQSSQAAHGDESSDAADGQAQQVKPNGSEIEQIVSDLPVPDAFDVPVDAYSNFEPDAAIVPDELIEDDINGVADKLPVKNETGDPDDKGHAAGKQIDGHESTKQSTISNESDPLTLVRSLPGIGPVIGEAIETPDAIDERWAAITVEKNTQRYIRYPRPLEGHGQPSKLAREALRAGVIDSPPSSGNNSKRPSVAHDLGDLGLGLALSQGTTDLIKRAISSVQSTPPPALETDDLVQSGSQPTAAVSPENQAGTHQSITDEPNLGKDQPKAAHSAARALRHLFKATDEYQGFVIERNASKVTIRRYAISVVAERLGYTPKTMFEGLDEDPNIHVERYQVEIGLDNE